MPTLINVAGNDHLCSNFMSLASNLDLHYQPLKRARIDSSFVFGDDRSAIESLPDECLFEIFRRLPGPQERSVSACVSRRWLSMLSSIRASEIAKQNGKNVTKKPAPAPAPEEDQEQEADGHLTRCLEGKEATDLRIAALAVGTAGRGGLGKLLIRGSHPTRGVTDRGLSAIARGCPSLRVLTMWKVPSVTDAGLAEIAEGCPLLERLDLVNCPLISDKGLLAVAQKCANLTSLTIDACTGINNEGLLAIGRNCAKLSSVSIKDCPLVGDRGVAGLISYASPSLTKIKLQNLGITDSSLGFIGYYGKAVTDLWLTGLQNVGERGFWVMGNALGLQKLKSIFITSCRGVTDLGLEAIAKSSPSLKQLCVRQCCYLSDAGLKAFAGAANSLECLQLEECNRITLVGVIGALLVCDSKLKTLALVKCLGIKDISFCPAELPRCTSLRSLTIRDCPDFTDRSLAFVGKICPQLQQIDLSGLVGVTDAGFLPLVESSSSRLVKVSLNGCVNLTDAVIVALVKGHGETLQLLHLDGCKNVSDRSLLTVADRCMVLEEITLSKSAVSDYGIAALASARQLDMRMISLASCNKLTDKCLPLLGNMGQSLVGLNFQNCNLISTRGIDLLEAKLWWCDILS